MTPSAPLQELHAFYDSLPSGICLLSTDGREQILFASQGLLSLYACRTQEEFQALRDFNRKVDLPTKLSDIGVTVADVEKAAPEVVKDADLEHYPYRVTEDMIVEAARRLDTAE